MARSPVIRIRRGVLGAEVSGFASHLDVLPPSGVLERMTVGCLTGGGFGRSSAIRLCRNRLLDQAGDYAAFNFQPLPLQHLLNRHARLTGFLRSNREKKLGW